MKKLKKRKSLFAVNEQKKYNAKSIIENENNSARYITFLCVSFYSYTRVSLL